MAAYSPAGESPVAILPGLNRALSDSSTAEKAVTTTDSSSTPGVEYIPAPESGGWASVVELAVLNHQVYTGN
ncbi:hypothetical protein SCARD494_11291 [Seiridium cardinale]